MIATMPCTQLAGVGSQIAKRLEKINIVTVQDLLFYLPAYYQDRSYVTPLNNLIVDMQVLVEGEIADVQIMRTPRSNLICRISDKNGELFIRFLHFYREQQKVFKIGAKIRCYGVVRFNRLGFEMIHPEYQITTANKFAPIEKTLTPTYPTTEGLSQNILRKIIMQALNILDQYPLPEYLPEKLLKQFNFPKINEALLHIHRPKVDANLSLLAMYQHPAQQRLIFEELLAYLLGIRRQRLTMQSYSASALNPSKKLLPKLLADLPFKLTGAQQRVMNEINTDLQKSVPMLRLLQGDVGSGKTIVAVAAALQAIENGMQAAIMAPTELLAEQHYQNFCHWLKDIDIALLSGKVTPKERLLILSNIASGVAKIVVGTHALLQEKVVFANLALVIIDEQHRFGVHQRLMLREKGLNGINYPHQLIMTATPIPRTLAMLAYADLDSSFIDELPVGRKPIATTVINNSRRAEVLSRVRNSCHQGRQVYWVCPLIEESDNLQCQAAEKTAINLTQNLSELKIGLVHGKLKPAEKSRVMEDFKNNQINLLVATTVIEVGIDVANASLMIIENAERLGLAQLHQLRGRVGRGTDTSFCVLMYQSPLSTHAKERLLAFRNQHDGFLLAQKDLELRGPGELLGTQQKGLQKMRVADVLRDQQLLPKVQQSAAELLQNNFKEMDLLISRWIGRNEKYGAV
jgi:ATP-dependent DNA helicase RecG